MTFFPVSVDELKYDKNRIFTRLKLRADPNTNAYAESIFPVPRGAAAREH